MCINSTKILACRILVTIAVWNTKGNAKPAYEIWQFQHEPGIYFEEIGKLQQTEATWKLAIKTDVIALNIRHQQIQKYLEQTEKLCTKVQDETQQTCQNILVIIEKNNTKLTQLILSL